MSNFHLKYLITALFCFCLIANKTHAQDSLVSKQYQKIKESVKKPCEIYHGLTFTTKSGKTFKNGERSYFFIDYVLDSLIYTPVTPYMISNRSELVELNAYIRISKGLVIRDTILNKFIEISLSTRMNSVNDIKFDSLKSLIPPHYDAFSQEDLGLLFNHDSIKRIDSIGITYNEKILQTPSFAFSNIYNPNLTDVFVNIQPVKVYLEEQRNELYIYIFGYSSIYSINTPMYMVKLIYNLDTGYVGRIVANSETLSEFNCYCSDFIGF